jgi:hypothetical protein
MLFENDHNLIDTEIMKIEEEIEKISDIKSNLYQISSIDEFKNFRGNLGQFLFKIEEEISNIIFTLKSIQNTNRKFYDNFAKNKNDFEDVLKQLEYYANDNKILINNLNLANKNIDYLNKINLNQEKYIEELISKLQGKEIEFYGGIITKKKSLNDNDNNNSRLNLSEESNKLNYDYNDEKIMIQNKIFKDNNNNNNINNNINNNNKNLPHYMENFINNKKKEINNNKNKEENKSEDYNNNINNNINKSDNISNINNTNSINNISNKESDNNTINQNINNLKFLENKITSNNNNNNNNNLLNEDKPDILQYDKVWDLYNNIKNRQNFDDEEKKNKEKIDKVQDIVLKIFQNENMLKYFKNKYGNNFENDVLNENVSSEFLKEIENEILKYENNKNNNNKNNNNNNFLNEDDNEKNISIPERDLNDEIPTAKFKSNKNSNNNNNDNENNEEISSKFKNYFMFNLQREKMFQAQKENKKKNNK